MIDARSIARVLSFALLSAGLVAPVAAPAQTPRAGEGKVKVEWLGHEFYRLTSPKGVVVITSPWLANPDGPVAVNDLARTDFILVPNSHNDDMGNPIEIAAASGATVFAPGPLGQLAYRKGTEEGAVSAGWHRRQVRLERHHVQNRSERP